MKSRRQGEAALNSASPQLRLDHIYLIAKKWAPEIQQFKHKGFFVPDIASLHPGFGTRGRTIYFQNFYIELHWIEDELAFATAMLPLYGNKRTGLSRMKTGVALYSEKSVEPALPSLLTTTVGTGCIPGVV